MIKRLIDMKLIHVINRFVGELEKSISYLTYFVIGL